jgi:hypothetical protein
MVDVVVGQLDEPPTGLDWAASVRTRVLTARGGQVRHPWLRSAIEAQPLGGPAVLGYLDAVAGDMRRLQLAFPYVAAIAADAATRNPGGVCDEQAEFGFTLDLLLDAFARLHETGWQSRPVRGERRASVV